jgi:hypothetical protein
MAKRKVPTMKNTSDLNLKFDFSGLSKGRLKTFNMLAEEIDRMEERHQTRELSEDELSFLSAAGHVGFGRKQPL